MEVRFRKKMNIEKKVGSDTNDVEKSYEAGNKKKCSKQQTT